MSSSAMYPSFGAADENTARQQGLGQVIERRVEAWIDSIVQCPWTAHAGLHALDLANMEAATPTYTRQPLYTPEERVRRDSSVWTLVQGILAPVQFLVFLISAGLVIRYLATGEGAMAATISVLIKTMLLYTIMITGCIWEKVVFGKYLFAPAFFWEDVFSMLVLALHTTYLGMVFLNIGSPREQLILALAAYAAYAVNAVQFVWKLRMARLEAATSATTVAA